MQQLLVYMYGGSVDVHTTDAFALLSGAMQLLVKGNLIPKTKALLLQYLKQHRMIDPIIFLRQMLESNLLDDEMLEGCAVVISDELERLWKSKDDSFLAALDENSMISYKGNEEEDELDEQEREKANERGNESERKGKEEEKQERGFAIWAWLALPYPAAYCILRKLRTSELVSKCAWKYIFESLSHGGIAPEDGDENSEFHQQAPIEVKRIKADLHAGLRCSEIETLVQMMHGSPSLDGVFFLLVHALKFSAKPLTQFCVAGLAKAFNQKVEGTENVETKRDENENEKGKERKKEGEAESERESEENAFFAQLAKAAGVYGKGVLHPIVCEVLRQECLAVRSEDEVLHFILRYQQLASTHLYNNTPPQHTTTQLSEEEVKLLWETLRVHLCSESEWERLEGGAYGGVPNFVMERKEALLKELLEKQVPTLHVLSAVRSIFGLRDHQRTLWF